MFDFLIIAGALVGIGLTVEFLVNLFGGDGR